MKSINDIIMDDLDYFRSCINDMSTNVTISKTSRKGFDHIKSRLIERDIHNLDLKEIVHKFNNHIEQFLDYANLEYDIRPFKINIKDDNIIVVISRVDDYVWKISTVLNPKIHNLHLDEVNSSFEKTIEMN